MIDGEILRWTATTTGVVAAILVAGDFGRYVTGIGFAIFTVSSVTWIVSGHLLDLESLVAQNAALTVVNVLGVYRWLIRGDGPERRPHGSTRRARLRA
jgi:hypothetical protein